MVLFLDLQVNKILFKNLSKHTTILTNQFHWLQELVHIFLKLNIFNHKLKETEISQMKKISSTKIKLRKGHPSKKFHFKNNYKSNQNQNKLSSIKNKSKKKNFTKCLILSSMLMNLKENKNNLNFKNKNPYKNYSTLTEIIMNMSAFIK